MSAEQRREAILRAAVPLFARKGFHAVKTRELAAAANVSEALLFKHFPSKEALYEAMQRYAHGGEEESEPAAKFLALPASTEKLMLGLHLLVSHLAADAPAEEKVMPRLLVQSLLGDGRLAQVHLEKFRRDWWPAFVACLRAARAAGDAEATGTPDLLLVWMFHHLGFALRILKLPGDSVDYGVGPEALVQHAVRFLLRGMGVSPEVIAARYRPQQLVQLLA